MTKLKRPERYVQFESIKPELKEITEFYTRKTADYQYKIKQLNEYVDSLENEISVLKETPKVEVLQPPKPQQSLPVVPEDVDKAIKYLKGYNTTSFSDFDDILTTKGLNWLNDFQLKDRRFGFGGLNNKLFILSHLAITGYKVEKEQLYHVKLPKTVAPYLNLIEDTGDFIYGNKEELFNCKTKFTEQEIKEIDPRYLAFSVKIED